MVDSKNFMEEWLKHWNYADFVADNLKFLYPDNWLRFYTLTEGKRYAETAKEEAVIQQSYLDIITRTLHEEVYLLTCKFGDQDAYQDNPGQLKLTAIPIDASDGQTSYRHVFLSVVARDGQDLKKILQLVAEDEMAGVILTDATFQWLLHPYDGGIDVIGKSKVALKDLTVAHRNNTTSDHNEN